MLSMDNELIFFHSRICPRCVRVRQLLKKIQEEHPDLVIKKIESLPKVILRKVYTLPAIKIDNTIIYGKEITERRILKELNLS